MGSYELYLESQSSMVQKWIQQSKSIRKGARTTRGFFLLIFSCAVAMWILIVSAPTFTNSVDKIFKYCLMAMYTKAR